MADNYLEKRYEEVFGAGAARRTVARHNTPSLNTLLVRNRTIRRYRQDFVVTADQLRIIVEVNAKVASAFNRQALRFRIVTEDNADVHGALASGSSCIWAGRTRLAAEADSDGDAGHLSKVEALRKILFREQMRPESARAFIIVYTSVPEDRYIDIDLGISLQSMALKATELGLNCLIKGNIDREKLRELFSGLVPESGTLEPLAVLCIGKAAESVFLKPSTSSQDLTPYTKDGVHYVPKLQTDDLII